MTIASRTMTIARPRAVYEALTPDMDERWISDGRGDLLYPVVLWVKAGIGSTAWNRMSGVVELTVARRWKQAWSRGGKTVGITPATRISKTVYLPTI
jgi:hypothetical protein